MNTKEQIEKVIENIGERENLEEEKPKCPGMKYKHYSPEAKVIIVKFQEDIKEVLKKYPNKKIKSLNYKNEIEMAKKLFKDFRDSDKEGFEIILVKEIKDEKFGCAIMNRLKKAAGDK